MERCQQVIKKNTLTKKFRGITMTNFKYKKTVFVIISIQVQKKYRPEWIFIFFKTVKFDKLHPQGGVQEKFYTQNAIICNNFNKT